MPDVVGSAGVLVAPGDPHALAAAIRAVTNDANQWQALRDAGLERAKNYTWEAVADGMQSFTRSRPGEASAPSAGLDVVVVAYGNPINWPTP